VTPLRILIVEDNRINRIVLRDLLARDGHAVDEAHDGQQGLDRVRRTSYDIVFMDISMPVMDGVEATRAIRKSEARGTRIPLIALTAHARTADNERFRAAGLDDILVKPITRDGLRAIIAKFCKPGGVAEVAAQAPSPDAALVDPGQLDTLAEALGRERVMHIVGEFATATGADVRSATRSRRPDAPCRCGDRRAPRGCGAPRSSRRPRGSLRAGRSGSWPVRS
jgi:CheY-like chemotaxis protein